MAELISGPTMVLNWLQSAATTTLAADYRTVSWNPSTAYAEVTAGSDTQVGRIPTIKDATCAIELVGQTAGTGIAALLAPGQVGTLIIQPEGTATNKRKITLPAYSNGATFSFPYADVMVISCEFSGSSSLNAYTDAAN